LATPFREEWEVLSPLSVPDDREDLSRIEDGDLDQGVAAADEAIRPLMRT
jgi:hypothetical protein